MIIIKRKHQAEERRKILIKQNIKRKFAEMIMIKVIWYDDIGDIYDKHRINRLG